MRKVSSPKAISIFTILTMSAIVFNFILGFYLYQVIEVITPVLYFIMPASFFLTNILAYRLLFSYLKYPQHQIMVNTADDISLQIYLLYYLIFFNFLIQSHLVPALFSRIFNQLLGAKFGKDSYSSGFILDPPYVKIGENTIIGFNAVLCSHAIEGEEVTFEKIIIGNNVTIGLRAIIMPGVIIEDNAVIAAGALITKNTHIQKNEIWAGIPAKKLQKNVTNLVSQISSVAS